MATVTLPAGWTDRGTHPEDGVSAYSHTWYAHDETGVELTIWEDIEPGSADYTVDPTDNYAVELIDTSQPDFLLFGEAFETEQAAIDTAEDAMNDY